MSKSHSTPNLSPPHPHHPAPPDLAALAAALRETAEALLAVQTTTHPEAAQEPAAKTPVREDDGETRSFYFPSAAVRLERDLLRRHRTDDFQGLLEEVHTLLVGLVKIMRSVHKDVRVRGYVIASLGAQLDHASALVLRMRNVYDGVVPVRGPA